jgi:hypothetical protein
VIGAFIAHNRFYPTTDERADALRDTFGTFNAGGAEWPVSAIGCGSWRSRSVSGASAAVVTY